MATSHGGPLAAALHDLQHIFGDRLLALVGYGAANGQPGDAPAQSLAIVQSLLTEDLDRCATRIAAWHAAGCATPLLLTRAELAGSLDAFPIEYGEIHDTRQIIFGSDPFAALSISVEDLRRECETQVKSHLVHLRENYIECRGRPAAIAALVSEAAPGFRLLLRRLARLDGFPASTNVELGTFAMKRPGLDPRTVGDVLAIAGSSHPDMDAVKLYPGYLTAVEQLWHFIDGWRSEPRQ